jgi:DNA polymerase I-like protein with 3'-5' exonuclease and polymerase domains
MRIALDIETTLAHDHIWCCVTKDLDTKEVKVWKEAKDLSEYIKDASLIVAHNGIAFDFYLLNRLWNCQIKLKTVADTLILSRLLNPSRDGGHSLAAWGETLGYPKTEFNDFELKTHTLDEMITYCINDVEVLAKLYNHLAITLQSEEFSLQSQRLEHEVQAIITKQERAGFKLNQVDAIHLLTELKTKLDFIEVEMQSIFPARVESNRISKLGKPLNDIVTPFNPGSRKQIAERLIEKGWKPTKYTEKGSVIVDETTLEGLDFPEAKAIAEYLMLQKRIAQVDSWLKAVKEDGRVHGRVITNGAQTGRMTHMSPNMAQVPNSGAVYGPECRALWTVEKGNKLVGIDASGLELRMLAHYMNDDAYTNEVVSGDIHTANQAAAGLQTRNQAKTFIYAFLYGAGSAKIGAVVGGTAKEGQKLIDSFLRNTPKLQRLRKAVADAYAKRGRLQGLDGRKLLCRSEHSALNTLLQGAGAIVMKQAVVILHKKLVRAKIWHQFVANVHDEWQIEVREEDAETTGKLGVESIEEAGIVLKMNCPLTGEYKVGDNWKETH